MRKTFSTCKNQRGQIAVEFILLAVLISGLSLMLASFIRNNDYLASQVSAPWLVLSGMIEHGSWGRPQEVKGSDPTYFKRKISLKGETQ